ncbi:MAG: hypothetical protein KKE71_06740 [Nanoarchaeota archaeon]|nr:hypothetical protein [Nanoarchaeota archaeon]MBU4300316.1 hypothetical protein [Nanoarchaeota archaeon]MBU4452591.1 hypothetical protein [Nanoarchaeota archaeon]
MVTKYHRTVEDGIVLLGNLWIKQKRAKTVYRGNQRPLSIVDYNSKSMVNYQPDVYFKLRNNKKLIFEVLDSQEKKQDLIIADVIQSFLIEDVEGVIFVYSGNLPEKIRINEALVTIAKGLVYKGINESEIPFDRSGSIPVKREDAISPEKVKEILLKKIKEIESCKNGSNFSIQYSKYQ